MKQITKFNSFFRQMASGSSDEDASFGDEDWSDDSSNVDEFAIAETIELIESNPDEIDAQLLDSITEASQM